MVKNLLVSEVYKYRFAGKAKKSNEFLGLDIIRQGQKPGIRDFQTAFGWGGGLCGTLNQHIACVSSQICYSEYGRRESLDYKLIPWQGLLALNSPGKVLWGFSDCAREEVIEKIKRILERHHKKYHKLKEFIREEEYEEANRFLVGQRKEEALFFEALKRDRESLLDLYQGLRQIRKRSARRMITRNSHPDRKYEAYCEMETILLHRLEMKRRE